MCCNVQVWTENMQVPRSVFVVRAIQRCCGISDRASNAVNPEGLQRCKVWSPMFVIWVAHRFPVTADHDSTSRYVQDQSHVPFAHHKVAGSRQGILSPLCMRRSMQSRHSVISETQDFEIHRLDDSFSRQYRKTNCCLFRVAAC